MHSEAGIFATRIELPCRVFCGPGLDLELSATTVSIDTSSLILSMEEGGPASYLKIGERVRLELPLPVNTAATASRYLAVRARVSQVVQTGSGSRHLKFTFRKPSFKDRLEDAARKLPKSANGAMKGWAM
jgi:hypothetical protein